MADYIITGNLRVTGDMVVVGAFTYIGNASTASALLTSRLIGGSSFNGSANITSFPSPGEIGGGTPSSGVFTTLTATGAATVVKLGVGQAAPTTSGTVMITHTVSSSSAGACVTVNGALAAPASTDLHPNAFRDITAFTPALAGDAYTSFDAQSTMIGTVALNHYHGYQARHSYSGSGTLSIMSGYATTNMGKTGVGPVTFMRSFYVSQPTISGAGAVGQYDGIYMDALVNATGLVNAIYIAGANNVFMAGGQFGNSALLTFPAGATTCRGYFTFNQTSQTGLAVMNSNATATGTLVSFCNSGGTVQGSISQTNATTVAYNTSSDSRLKENVRDITDSGSIIDSWHPVLFDWKHGTKDIHGFLAQETYQEYPEAVTPGTDEVNSAGELLHPWSMDKTTMIPVIAAEVQSLRRRLALAGIAA